MMKPKAKQIVCKWCGHRQSITKDLEKAYQQGKTDGIKEVRSEILKILLEGEPTEIGRKVTIKRIMELASKYKGGE